MTQKISPCPVCGNGCDWWINDPKYVQCTDCLYRAPTPAAHEQICRAMEFVRDVAETVLDDLVGDEFLDTLNGIVDTAKEIIAGGNR